ncbi:hypothetical protein HPB50_019352 [Hyalomma asiaticum]|uniref:Uncharacterized protein n=1 Tax=Hyalomma asiaticum TaxID=266040 RepID=A0ACB7SJL0_HYAAI|nr:hypothetical protein HPB50_019352 [Hyalomma asiaticum]
MTKHDQEIVSAPLGHRRHLSAATLISTEVAYLDLEANHLSRMIGVTRPSGRALSERRHRFSVAPFPALPLS